MKKIDKIKNTAKKGLVTLLLPIMLYCAGCIKTQKACEIYRGYYTNFDDPDDGRIVYIFDPKNEKERCLKVPKYKIYGDASLTDSLEIGKLYNITIKKGCLPWSGKYIKSIVPCASKDSGDK